MPTCLRGIPLARQWTPTSRLLQVGTRQQLVKPTESVGAQAPFCAECGEKDPPNGWVIVEGQHYCDNIECGETAQEEANLPSEEEDDDEPENEYDDTAFVFKYPKAGELIQQKWFQELGKHDKDQQILSIGANSKNAVEVMWYQLQGTDTINIEHLPEEKQGPLRDFIERLKWIGGTDISWTRGGHNIQATLPEEFLIARY